MIAKLAFGNVRKSLRDFAVYFATVALGVAVFYAFNTIADQADFLNGDASGIVASIGGIMHGLTVFLALVLGFLMVYANNFLVRRRKRELGLYQMLGMRRSQVSAVLALETLISGVGAFVCGLVLGVLLSQLLVFVTAALFHDTITAFSFRFSPEAAWFTFECFALMFAVMLLFNMRALRRVRLVDLMEADRVNEEVKLRSLPASVVIFLVGAVLIGVSYARLLHDGLPVAGFEGEAGRAFCITTGMVCAGTVAVFYALSGFLVSLMQRVPRVYWRGLNMLTLRQLNSRVNTASGSMAAISMILFLAITAVTTGVSVCSAFTSNIEEHNPYDASIDVWYFDSDSPSSLQSLPRTSDGRVAPGYGAAAEEHDVVQMLADAGYDLSRVADYNVLELREASGLAERPSASFDEMTRVTGATLPASVAGMASDGGIQVVGVSEFNALRSLLGLDPIELGEDEYAMACDLGESLRDFYSQVMHAGYTIALAGRDLVPSTAGVIDDASGALSNSIVGSNPGYFIVPDDIAAQAPCASAYINMRYKSGMNEEARELMNELVNLQTGNIFKEGQATFAYIGNVIQKEESWSAMNGMTGIVSYMAVYIGFVLVVSCAAILAIQQLCATTDAQHSWRLLWELGCPRKLVYRCLLMQTLVYFLLPLVVALAHSMVALSVVRDVVEIFGAFDITTAAISNGALFVAVYGAYLFASYRLSRSMVNATMGNAGRLSA